MVSHKEKFIELAEQSNRIVITSHMRPDADSIASCLGMYHWVHNNLPKKECHIYYLNPPDYSYEDFYLFEKIEWVEEFEESIQEGDFLVFLDGNPPARFTNEPEKLKIENHSSYCIDHHEVIFNKFSHHIIDTTAASTAEIITRYFYTDDDLKDKKIAEVLMMGLLRDSGQFGYLTPEKSEILSQAKRIVDNGKVNIKELVTKLTMMQQDEYDALRIFIQNSKIYKGNTHIPSFIYSYITAEDFKRYTSSAVKNAYHIFMGKFFTLVQGCPWGVVIVDQGDSKKYKMSFRSTYGGPDVALLSKSYFNGGGHKMASGGHLPYEEAENAMDACAKVIAIIESANLEIL